MGFDYMHQSCNLIYSWIYSNYIPSIFSCFVYGSICLQPISIHSEPLNQNKKSSTQIKIQNLEKIKHAIFINHCTSLKCIIQTQNAPLPYGWNYYICLGQYDLVSTLTPFTRAYFSKLDHKRKCVFIMYITNNTLEFTYEIFSFLSMYMVPPQQRHKLFSLLSQLNKNIVL